MYSTYINDHNETDKNLFKNFINDKIINESNYEYSFTSKLSLDSSYIRDNKLIIGSKDPNLLLKRLISHLKLYKLRFKKKFNNFYKKSFIDKAYTSILQFKHNSLQTLSYRSQKHSTLFNNSIQTNINNIINPSPYLLQFNNHIYLANDCTHISKNIYISHIWNRENINYMKCDKSKSTQPNIFNTSGKQIIHANSNINIIYVNNQKYISLLSL